MHWNILHLVQISLVPIVIFDIDLYLGMECGINKLFKNCITTLCNCSLVISNFFLKLFVLILQKLKWWIAISCVHGTQLDCWCVAIESQYKQLSKSWELVNNHFNKNLYRKETEQNKCSIDVCISPAGNIDCCNNNQEAFTGQKLKVPEVIISSGGNNNENAVYIRKDSWNLAL